MTNVKWRPLNQKLSPADDLRWSAEKDLFLPTHGLDSTRSMNPHRRVGSFRPDRGYSGSARTRARRLRFSDPTFEESGFDIILIFYDHKLNIYPILEVMMPAPVRMVSLPWGCSEPSVCSEHLVCPEQRCAATQRVPLPEISASDPSALNSRARMSASWAGNNHSTPSAPMPRWRSHIRLLKPPISAGTYAPSTIRKSLPHALALTNGI